MRRSLLACVIGCALTACGGGGSSDGAAESSAPSAAAETTTASTADRAAAAQACTETRLALAPVADGLAGGDLESALLSAELPSTEPSGTTPTVELALGRLELQLSFAKQAAELGVFGTDNRADLQRAFDELADACTGIGADF
ncbi:hypothetical protein [Blastococcus sp. TF02-09]|uniref:hypothetical protein n=1 Tax=Blastococcus sp. TF02-09 TaxID=2250576 RepID=UPI000DEA51E7|nr:hypothetical protein [Blastococcus sp. TF02-9]